MGSTSLNYKEKLAQVAQEATIHLLRLDEAFLTLQEKYKFPINEKGFESILNNDLSYADQIIYRFSKAQDTIRGKLFRAFVVAQGESAERPFLDILNALEKIRILMVEDWFVLRDLRNEIAHNYDSSEQKALGILNDIYKNKHELKNILDAIIRVAGINLGDNKLVRKMQQI